MGMPFLRFLPFCIAMLSFVFFFRPGPSLLPLYIRFIALLLCDGEGLQWVQVIAHLSVI